MTVRLILTAAAPTAATGRAAFPRDDAPLTHAGRADAVRAAHGIGRAPTSALRGPERRCAETAAALGLDAAAEPALADLDAGRWRGAALDQVEADDPAGLLAWLSGPDAAPHGGESLGELAGRVAGFLDGLPSESAKVVAVTHPAVIRAAVLHVLDAPIQAFWNLDVPPLSQTRLSWNAGKWRLRETGHPLG